jgi:NifB/MoaA-like Fe-S oxidoreductase
MDQLRWLGERDIEVHTQLVVTPEVNDGHWLEQSIRDLETLWPGVRSLSVVPVGLTKHHKYKMRTHTPEEAAVILDYVESLQADYLEKFGVRFVYPTDEWYLVTGREVPPLSAYDGQDLHENGLGMVRYFLDAWQGEQAEIKAAMAEKRAFAYEKVTLVTGLMFAEMLARETAVFRQLTHLDVTVQPILNEKLGARLRRPACSWARMRSTSYRPAATAIWSSSPASCLTIPIPSPSTTSRRKIWPTG